MARGKYKGPKRGAGQRLRGQSASGPTQEQEDAFREEAGAASKLALLGLSKSPPCPIAGWCGLDCLFAGNQRGACRRRIAPRKLHSGETLGLLRVAWALLRLHACTSLASPEL